MSQRVFSPATYIAVFIALALLTVLTVGISFVGLTGHWHLIFGVSIAVTKATLVVLFFMHMIASPRVTWMVLVVSLFWLSVVLMGLTFSDYATRAGFPFVPGH